MKQKQFTVQKYVSSISFTHIETYFMLDSVYDFHTTLELSLLKKNHFLGTNVHREVPDKRKKISNRCNGAFFYLFID